MTTSRKSFLRSVMTTAWGLFRAEPSRDFADCLRGAWSLVRRFAEKGAKLAAKAKRARRLHFSPSLIRSPIARALTGQSRAGFQDHKAALITTAVGG